MEPKSEKRWLDFAATSQDINTNVIQVASFKLHCWFNLVYRVGSDLGWSNVFWFRAYPRADDVTWSPRLAVFGDLGNIDPQALPRLQEEAQSDLYDMVLHIGDFAYDMDWVKAWSLYLAISNTDQCSNV